MKRPAATVYLVTNLLNGKQYVGVTRFSLEERWKGHCYSASRPVSWLHKAIAKYGESNFTIEPIASCLSADSAGDGEREAIMRIRPAYNQVNGGRITFGRKLSAETRAKISAANIGRTMGPKGRARCRAFAVARWQSDPDFRSKTLAALERGRANADWPKIRAAAGAAARGRVWSAESRAKLSASCMGRRYGREILDRIAEKHKKAVECIELKTVFDSVSEAAEGCGLSITSVSRTCRGERPEARGLHFVFVT